MKNCVIWGTGKIGSSQVLKDILEQKYHIQAYCDSDSKKAGKKLNMLDIISAEEIREYLLRNSVSSLFIAVADRSAIESIRSRIRENHIEDIEVIDLYGAEMDELENCYLSKEHERLKNRWEINFEERSRTWVKNLLSEVEYWIESYSKNKGAFIKAYLRNEDFTAYSPEYEKFSEELKNGDVVLDIGSGITSKFGCITKRGCRVRVDAVDPLAYYYNQFLPENTPEQKKCHFGLFEFIADFYPEGSADGIVINNALDHCIDPFKSIVECLYILKENGHMCTLHRRAEAVYEKYTGLHRWNMDYNSMDHFIIWNQEHSIDVTKALEEIADVMISHSEESVPREKQTVMVTFKKKRKFNLDRFIDMPNERYHLAGLLEQLMKYFTEADTAYIYQQLQQLAR